MSVVAEFTIPVTALPFGETLVDNPNVRIELERVVPTNESTLPFFWVRGPEPSAFMESAEEEPNIVDVCLLDRLEDGALFRAEWTPNAAIIRGIERLEATIVEAVATADHWRFQIRAQEREAFADFLQIFDEQGVSIHLDSLHELSHRNGRNHRPLTPEQREMLITAYRKGYYDRPRGITQEELGERFGISHRAVSERLRRGTRNFIASTLLSAESRE